MKGFYAPIVEYVEGDAYLQDASDGSFVDEAWASEIPAGRKVLDDQRFVRFILPLGAVLIAGLCLVFLTSLINYDQAPQVEEAQSYSGISKLMNKAPTQYLPVLFTPQVLYWEAELYQWASEHGIDIRLAATVMQIESCGNPEASSWAGAIGLFQVMPYHFQAGEDGYKPAVNARRGLAYLKQALDIHQGDVRLALASYNAGITGASRAEAFWPAETQRYVYWGMGIYADAMAGNIQSDRLQEWLQAGGSSLCNQASLALNLH